MTDHRNIRPLTAEERAQPAAERQAQRERKQQMILDQLDDCSYESEKGDHLGLNAELSRSA